MLIPVIIVVALIALLMISTYNKLVTSKEKVNNAMGQIATNVESRWDALTSLISATKEYSQSESQTLMDITNARSGVTPNASAKDVVADDELFAQAMRSINVVVENYPELKASNLYQSAMGSIDKYENNVRLSRQIYNDTVTMYNRQIKVFPTNLIAGMLGFDTEEYFAATESKVDMPSW